MNEIAQNRDSPRIAALRRYGILDSPAEQSFDDLVRLAALVCETPIALITLVDDKRQWFKAKVGISIPETPKEYSMCAHAIEQRAVFMVKDAHKDQLFSTNPLVTGNPCMRFYAGVPLLTDDGEAIGTICVIDRVPRELTPIQMDALQSLSRQVMKQLELRLLLREQKEIVAELERTQRALQASEERFELAVRGSNAGIWDWNINTNEVYHTFRYNELRGFAANQSVCNTLEEFYESVHPEDRKHASQAVKAHLEERVPYNIEYRLQMKSGEYRWFNASGQAVWDEAANPYRMVGFITDISERKKMEEQSLRSQRMESIGTLAGGIAHDLNNVLAPILMTIQMLKHDVKDPEALNLLETLEVCSKRGAHLVKQVLSFSRGIEGQRVVINPDHIMRELNQVLHETFPKSIVLDFNIQQDLWTVRGDPTQLHQIFMNLCVNARDAMPNGGELTVILENKVVDETYAAMNPDSRPGSYVVATIVDTGTGISPKILGKIFEPFFTTKEIGKGTGLGLSTTLGIIKSHGGFINVYSEMGKGTKFKVYLPANTTEAATEKVAIEQTGLPYGQGELVLLVDDEEVIRKVAKQTLQRYGYRVLLASNGAEAVARYALQHQEIAVILTDMAMPVMDGATLIIAVKAINPHVRIIGSSGNASNGGLAKAIGAGVEHFIPKPYTAEVLLKILQKVLNN